MILEATFTLFLSTSLLLGSPGPAPLSLAIVSSSFGLRAGVNYVLGILSGLFIVSFLTGLGLYEVLKVYPKISFLLSTFALIYMLYIIYKIAFANSLNNTKLLSPPSYKDGFILNITNPKAYAAFFAIYSGFLLPIENTLIATALTGLIAFMAGVFVDLCWVFFGLALSRVLTDTKKQKTFRYSCALILLITVLYSVYKTIDLP